ncbi:hypothetical protein LR48_Vigan10g127100 [Vigna angularis]|uniref:Uncharacterized protein n=1 Tax=Phaseolus angularis TaxID=3914 RepID=A0A0L9VKX4_PHAAN|nr:hypothetical protein LR48_Vigan10g127100 [Vigna angularis]
MTGQGSERPDKGKGVARPRKRQWQAPKYVLRVPARLPTTTAGSTSSVGPPPTPTVQPPTPAIDPTPTPAVQPSTTPTTDPLPPSVIITPTPPPVVITPTPPRVVITPTPIPDPTSIPSSSVISPSDTVTPSADQDSSGDGEDLDPPLHDRTWIEPYGKGFIPSRVASQAITRSIKQQFLSPWPTWGAIPDDDKKPFWERFQMKVQWKLEHESQIHRNFHMKASHRLSEMFRDARNAGQRPYWLGEIIWNSLLAHWNTEEFSTRLSQVRSEHESAPTPDDASNAEDDIRRTQCWIDIVGGKKKGRVYGAGQLAANYTTSRGGTLKHQPSSSTTTPDEVILRLTQALQQRDQEITDLRVEFTNFKALVMRVLPATSQDELVIPPTQPQPSSSPAVPQQPTSVQPSSVQPTPVQQLLEEQDDEDHSDDNYLSKSVTMFIFVSAEWDRGKLLLPPSRNTPPRPIDLSPFALFALVFHTNGLTCSKHFDAQISARPDILRLRDPIGHIRLRHPIGHISLASTRSALSKPSRSVARPRKQSVRSPDPSDLSVSETSSHLDLSSPSPSSSSSLPPLSFSFSTPQVTMSSDFSGDEGREYADDDIASPSSSLVAITGTGARASPSRNSSDLLVDSDAPEEVAIHVDSTGAWDGKLRAWPTIPGYDWVPNEVRQISSSFHHHQPFRDLISHISLVKAAADARHFKLTICQMTERVCHDRGNYPTDFFYVYSTMFKDLKVLLPFSDFQMGVLRTLNVAPTQLHSNVWAFMQAFSAICSGLALKPMPAAFLYFFHVQPHPSKPWVFLRTVGNKHLLSLYNSSYKDFKGHFFKVMSTETGYRSFCSPTKEAKFPFYWTRDPRKVLSWPKPQMTPGDLDLINQLCQLPLKSSCRVLIGFLGNKNLPSNVFDYLSKMDPSKNSTFARLFAQRGGDVRKPGGGSSHAPSTVVAPAPSHPIQQTSVPPPPVEVVPDQATPIESNLKKKGKRKAAREASAESKHAKSRLPDGPPLPSLLSPNSWVAKRIHFDLFVEEKALVSGVTEEEASNMALELTARLAMCLAYAAQQRASASTELQALQAKFDATFKANQDLTLRLAETERIAEEDKNKAMVNEHVLGFDKALAQCNLLFQVPTDDPRLDVSMMVVDNKLVPIYIPPSSPPAAKNVDAVVEVVGETGEAKGQS